MKSIKKIIVTIFCVGMLFSIGIMNINAVTLSASKTMSSGSYGTSILNRTATASCPTTGTFSWTTSTKDSYVQGSAYSIYTKSTSKWTKSNYTATYTWNYQVMKLPSGASGPSTEYDSGTKKATFKYNTSTKSLTVS